MILKLSLDLPEDAGFLTATRQIARILLRAMAVVETDVEDLELIIGELSTNVVRHAHSRQNRYCLKMEFYAEEAVLIIEDKGSGFAPGDVPEPGERPDTLTGGGGERIGGYGMRLVEALADKLEWKPTNPHGTTVRAVVDLHYLTPEATERAKRLDSDNDNP